MNKVRVNIDILPEKREEFIQAIRSINEELIKEKGFKSSPLFQDIEDPNHFSLIQEWETQDNLDDYLRSEYFRVLMGTLKVLAKHSKIEYNLMSDQSGKKILG